MSTILKSLGGFLLIAILAGAGGGTLAWYKAHALERDGARYVETTVPLIVANWDANEVMKRAAPEFLVPSIREGMPQVFQAASQLGKLKELGTVKGQVTFADFQISVGDQAVPMPPKILKPVWARFVVDGEFEAGSVSIMMDLVRRDGRWEIMGFYLKGN